MIYEGVNKTEDKLIYRLMNNNGHKAIYWKPGMTFL